MSARCGVGDGSPRPHPRSRSQWVVGPGRTPGKTTGRGWESTRPRTPHSQARGAPPGTLMPPPQRAKPARNSACCGVDDGSPRPHPPHPQPVGSGPQLHARKDGEELGERLTPKVPHPGKRRPPRAPSCHPNSAPSQHASARAVGYMTGPHARTPGTHSQWVVGPGRTPQRTSGRGWESARPRAPHTQARAPPPGALVLPPQRVKPAHKSARCGVGDGSPRPQPPHPQPVGTGPRPHAQKYEWSGVGERPTTDAPPQGKRRPPPGTVMPPHNAQSQLARACCGVDDRSPRPQPPHPQPVGSGPRPHARKNEWSGVGERPTPDAPHPSKGRPPRALSCRPHGAQSQLARARAVGSVTGPHARTPRTHSQWVVGPGRTPEGRSLWGWERDQPRTPHTQAGGAPPRGALLPPPQRAKPARKRARCGVGDGSPRRHPLHTQPVGSGPRPHARKDGRSGPGEHPIPDAQARASPPGTLMPPRQRAKPASKSACGGVGEGSSRPHPPHRQPVGSGPRPHARKHEWLGVGERLTPDAPHPGKRRPPRAPSGHPHSAQSQLARARAVGLVTGPHARSPRTHSQWVVGPGRTPQRTSRQGRESARPRTPHIQAKGAPPGHPGAAPTGRKASSQERARWGW